MTVKQSIHAYCYVLLDPPPPPHPATRFSPGGLHWPAPRNKQEQKRRDQKLLELRLRGELSYPEIAERLGMSVDAARKAAATAQARLRLKMARHSRE